MKKLLLIALTLISAPLFANGKAARSKKGKVTNADWFVLQGQIKELDGAFRENETLDSDNPDKLIGSEEDVRLSLALKLKLKEAALQLRKQGADATRVQLQKNIKANANASASAPVVDHTQWERAPVETERKRSVASRSQANALVKEADRKSSVAKSAVPDEFEQKRDAVPGALVSAAAPETDSKNSAAAPLREQYMPVEGAELDGAIAHFFRDTDDLTKPHPNPDASYYLALRILKRRDARLNNIVVERDRLRELMKMLKLNPPIESEAGRQCDIRGHEQDLQNFKVMLNAGASQTGIMTLAIWNEDEQAVKEFVRRHGVPPYPSKLFLNGLRARRGKPRIYELLSNPALVSTFQNDYRAQCYADRAMKDHKIFSVYVDNLIKGSDGTAPGIILEFLGESVGKLGVPPALAMTSEQAWAMNGIKMLLRCESYDVLKLCLQGDPAALNLADEAGNTPLLLAILYGKQSAAKLIQAELKKLGKDRFKVALRHTNKQGYNASTLMGAMAVKNHRE